MLRNAPRLTLHIPEPMCRPGDPPSFVGLGFCMAGETPRPDIDAPAAEIRDQAFALVRVTNDEGRAVGPWDPKLPTERLIEGLRVMLLTRAYDERMFRAQRQGKTSFYMKCTGEEAVAVGSAFALDRGDMCFPTYRQQGLLLARGYPMISMMAQVFSNADDPLKGRQMPVFYSSREFGFFSISGNLGTQFSQAVGWAMASSYKGDNRLAVAWIGEGATAEGDFHHALTFASVYRAPIILNVVNNQWAISSFPGIASSAGTTFAARAIGYGIPALRVDGNDFQAVFAATEWAAERARADLGPTLIEHVTYRSEGHSTSDDPARYRPADESGAWPLGDPVARLRLCLERQGALARGAFEAIESAVAAEVKSALKAAEAVGTLRSGERPSAATMFDDVYKDLPWHLRQQRDQAGCEG